MAKSTEEKLSRARGWLEGQKWKVHAHEVLTERGYESLTVKLTDSDKQLPRELMEAAVAAIDADETGEEQSLERIEGAPYGGIWKLKRIAWARDERGLPANDNVLELRKTYVRVTDGNSGAVLMENGCAYRVTYTYYWNQASAPVPPASTSGVRYRLVSAQQDQEDMLWTAVLECQVRQVQTTGPVVVRDDAFATVTEQEWLGIREDGTDEDGHTVAVWTVGNDPQGTVTEIAGLSKNEDCTKNVRYRRTVAKARTASVERRQNKWRTVTRITLRAQPERVDALVEVAGGVIYARGSEGNADGTFDNWEEISAARAGTRGFEATRTAFRDVVRVTLGDQQAPVAALVDVSGGVITRQWAEETDHGTWQNIEELSTVIPGVSRVEKSRTAWLDTVTVVLRGQTVSVAALVDVTGGVIVTQGSEAEEHGTWTNRETLSTLRPGVEEVRYERTAFRDIYRMTTRGEDAQVSGFVDVAGGVITAQYGRKNDHGKYDNTLELSTAISGTGEVERERNARYDIVRITNRNEEAESAAFSDVVGGVKTRRRSRQNDDKTWDNTEELSTEKRVRVERMTAADWFGTQERTTDIEAAAGADAAYEDGKEKTVTNKLTEHGQQEVTRAVQSAGDMRALITILTYGSGEQEVTVTFWNATTEDVEGWYKTYGDVDHRAVPGYQWDAKGRLYGQVKFVPLSSEFGGNYAFETGPLTEEDNLTVTMGGKTYKRTVTSTFYMKRDWGVSSGAAAYSGALSGSDFRVIGDDWYMMKKVTGISVTDVEFTPGDTITW